MTEKSILGKVMSSQILRKEGAWHILGAKVGGQGQRDVMKRRSGS